MGGRAFAGLALALAAALAPAMAAAQPVASGDCQRVRQIARDTPVTARFAGRYRGVVLVGLDASDPCRRDYVRLITLSPAPGGGEAAAFRVLWTGLYTQPVNDGTCKTMELFNEGNGAARIWQAVSERDGLCDLTIFLRLTLKNSDGAAMGDVTYSLQPQGAKRFMATPPNAAHDEVTAFYREGA